jgi:hypothetical protein
MLKDKMAQKKPTMTAWRESIDISDGEVPPFLRTTAGMVDRRLVLMLPVAAALVGSDVFLLLLLESGLFFQTNRVLSWIGCGIPLGKFGDRVVEIEHHDYLAVKFRSFASIPSLG